MEFMTLGSYPRRGKVDMTKRDYIKFAEMIRIELKSREPEISWPTRVVITRLVADIFANDNPRFNREKFYKACEK